jgi:hypothetical protein
MRYTRSNKGKKTGLNELRIRMINERSFYSWCEENDKETIVRDEWDI